MPHDRRSPLRPACPQIPERGRSRDVSPVAIARRASDDLQSCPRRPFTPPQPQHSRSQYSQRCPPSNTPSPASSPPMQTPGASSSNALSRVSGSIPSRMTRVGSKASARPRPSPFQHSMVPPFNSQKGLLAPCPPSNPLLWSDVSDTSMGSDDTPLPPRSLEDQMQEAYAADNMLLARILFLKIRGIDVTSDNDPRITQVRDEDFVFVPGGQLVLDDESLAALKRAEERERVKWEQKSLQKSRAEAVKAVGTRLIPQCSHDGPAYVNRANRSETKTSSPPVSTAQQQQGKPVRNLPTYVASGSPSSYKSNTAGDRRSLLPSSLPLFRAQFTSSPSSSVSFHEVVTRVQGRLFEDDGPLEVSHRRSRLQQDLLEGLLYFPDGSCSRSRRRSREKETGEDFLQKADAPADSLPSDCLACSSGRRSFISRTNSWASTISGTSLSTSIVTSPSTSPALDKPPLPPLLQDKAFLQEIVRHSCIRARHKKLTSVPLASTPLATSKPQQKQRSIESGDSSSHQHRAQVKNVLYSRVKQSVTNLLDLATKMQVSYVRTLQFALPHSLGDGDIGSLLPGSPAAKCRLVVLALQPEGYRVNCEDVKIFAPRLDKSVARDLNFPTEYNIPLLEHNPEQVIPQVSSPLPLVLPSPLRPRYIPQFPEWRLRPVANPVTLRLRALQNILCSRGVPWEGRAHSGSLGCGRERLTGVAFEGLGGSRLAFEAT